MKNQIYETYISKSRYARYLDDQKRRENWGETVERYMSFMEKHLDAKHGYSIAPELREELSNAILNFEVMPSMRALMTAGKALERDNVGGYNCAYLPIDDPKAFDEAMFILLCFAPETLVTVKGGVKPISELSLDDQVLSYNEHTKIYSYIKPSRVFETPTSTSRKLELTFEDGSVVRVTDNHKFLTSNRGWVEAKDLSEDDDIVHNPHVNALGFVYEWTNLINGKRYIGAHIGVQNDNYFGSGILFRKAVKKYGIENFTRKILHEERNSVFNLFAKEAEFIRDADAVFSENYYNLSSLDPKRLVDLIGAGFSYTRKMQEETKVKLSRLKRGVKHNLQSRLNMSRGQLNRAPFTKEHKQNLSLAQTGSKNQHFGKRLSKAHRTKISASNMGERNAFFGRKHSEKTKQLIREKAKVNNAGVKNPAAKAICLSGIVYSTIKEARASTGLSYKKVREAGELV